MGFATTVSDDLIMIGADDPRSVIYYRRTATAGDPPTLGGVTITGVLREDKSDGMMNAAGAVLPQGSTAFHVQASQVGARPRPGDVVADADGQRFSIDSVGVLGESTWYRVVGVPEVG